MIGDWVVNPAHNDIAQIEGIYYDKELYCLVGTDGRFPQEYYEPIPLTDDMLKANGIDEGELSYEFYDGYHFFLFKNATSVHVGAIWFVHELQHALRLCGLEELADNFKI